jgi:hypothetical protein
MNGELRIQSAGWESDLIEDAFGTNSVISLLGAADISDPIGIVNKVYDVSDTDLRVPKNEPSKQHPEDKTGMAHTAGDYNLRFHIEELKSYPAGTSVR